MYKTIKKYHNQAELSLQMRGVEDIYKLTKYLNPKLPENTLSKKIRNYLSFSLSTPDIQEIDVLFLIGTQNQVNSAKQTLSELKAKKINVGCVARETLNIENTKKIITFAQHTLLSKKLLQIARLFGMSKNNSQLHDDALMNIMGAIYLLEKTKTKMLVVYNEHSPINQQWMLAAQATGIPIVFIQHASVSKNNPAPLFTYGLLDGEFANETFKSNAQMQKSYLKKVYLVGQQKPIKKTRKRGVGIAINSMDDLDKVYHMALELETKNILLRCHPAQAEEDKTKTIEFCKKYGFSYSDSTKETPEEFLQNISHIIAGNTSILLEAALARVTPIYWTSYDTHDDYYSFVKNGIAVDGRGSNLKNLVQEKHININNIQYYSCTVGTEFEGKEYELSANVITALLENKEPDGYVTAISSPWDVAKITGGQPH